MARDKEKAKAQFRAWYIANHDAYLAKRRADYQAHLEEKRRYTREWARNHKPPPAQGFARRANENLRIRYGRVERLDWQNLSIGPCVYCGRDDETISWDHVIPLSQDGPNQASNCVRCCRTCNSQKHARTPEQWRDPALIEARRERKRTYIRQWHRDHYAELYIKRRARRDIAGHW